MTPGEGTAGIADHGAGRLTHIDDHGRARMVDVTGKAATARRAVARCVVRADDAAIRGLVSDPEDPLGKAQVAGTQAAKLTSQLIPLCHPLLLDDIDVRIEAAGSVLEVIAVATVVERTGVEMEALTACGLAGLTLVTALLPADPDATMDDLQLWHKSGGRSGTWNRAAATGEAPAAGVPTTGVG